MSLLCDRTDRLRVREGGARPASSLKSGLHRASRELRGVGEHLPHLLDPADLLAHERARRSCRVDRCPSLMCIPSPMPIGGWLTGQIGIGKVQAQCGGQRINVDVALEDSPALCRDD